MRGTKAFAMRIPRCGGRGFTLIELLVVISILVMLMALLLPTIERVKKQAKAVACQAKLRQWGMSIKMYTDACGGRLFPDSLGDYSRPSTWGVTAGKIPNWAGLASPSSFEVPNILACPMATRPDGTGYYDAFTVWCRRERVSPYTTSSGDPVFGPISYGVNEFTAWPPPDDPRMSGSNRESYWGTCDVRGTARIPILFDSAYGWARPYHCSGPPLFDSGPLVDQICVWPMCINRHDGGVNLLFMDWSVRKVGLKELWILKWCRPFDTAGAWTRQGGVQPEDWPPWMRRFKDY